MRVSGTWANSTWLADSARPPEAPPKGFNAVLTRQQWKGVVDFARAVDGRLVTSFATSTGARDDSGAWTPASARAFVEHTKSLGGSIVAAEFMNEPNLAAMGGAPAGYDAAAYGRDFKLFRAFAREAAPGMLVLGPGSVGEGGLMSGGRIVGLSSRDLLSAAGPGVDASRTTTTGRSRSAARASARRARRRRTRSRRSGSPARTRPSASTSRCATSSSPGNRSG